MAPKIKNVQLKNLSPEQQKVANGIKVMIKIAKRILEKQEDEHRGGGVNV